MGRPSEKELWEGNEAVLGGGAHRRPSARMKHFLTQRIFSDVGINVGGGHTAIVTIILRLG